MTNSLRKTWLPLGLLLSSLGWTLGCAGGVPQTSGSWRTMDGAGQRGATSQAVVAPRGKDAGASQGLPTPPAAPGRMDRSVLPSALGRSPERGAAVQPTQSTRRNSGETELSSGRRADATVASPATGAASSSERSSGARATSHHFSDSAVPNPLRNSPAPPPAGARLAGDSPEQLGELTAKATRQSPGLTNQEGRFAVQTVGYQEEFPEVISEELPARNSLTRMAMLEEPQPIPDPASVLEAAAEAPPNAAPLVSAEGLPFEGQLPLERMEADEDAYPFGGSDQVGDGPPGQDPIATLNAGGPLANQGHYQQGSAVFGQMLNPPQQTASQRALQLMEENRRLEEEMKAQVKQLESLQARLKQQDELWVRARQEFVEVRSVVDNLTRENLLLKQQLEKTEAEKLELARQYQGLMQTVEQTLDDLLLRAIAQPPSGNAAPAVPTTQPAPALPMFPGQQASAPKTSQ